jgi:predicted LPLAT superfamily acyltransferase
MSAEESGSANWSANWHVVDGKGVLIPDGLTRLQAERDHYKARAEALEARRNERDSVHLEAVRYKAALERIAQDAGRWLDVFDARDIARQALNPRSTPDDR